MTKQTKLTLLTDTPTQAAFADLADWVMWQFPKPNEGIFRGAIHPPTAHHGWLPAGINPQAQQVTIHAHATPPFPSPEEAADWLKERLEK